MLVPRAGAGLDAAREGGGAGLDVRHVREGLQGRRSPLVRDRGRTGVVRSEGEVEPAEAAQQAPEIACAGKDVGRGNERVVVRTDRYWIVKRT